ncbi:aspercryptin biosynthesis cluster-specific transcription regulator atnN [Colletotrichum spaethianum]|uniref:Aspercryptin biosynthesis cluster-specific transcription regulator atnN n=1 Tax=Colletotrichum spaethianum TaxID=700344 RepID=A0AA37L864_9PEZI|nr:aspercryptin biosynthesis cluster-specific transcription regulator atnN [Colletotrichum spaethianum]GKT43618.1 aspercryptin biosynthesis cluster-specific transcription regulator atnN [Colletotrichum spaethianum]
MKRVQPATGRKCDGYVTPPTGTYSWPQLLHVRPPPTQTAPDTELRGLAFFRSDVAPALAGLLDSYFWTHLVPQISHQEPAAKHAALAISSLYEKFNEGMDLSSENDAFAVAHYNKAIKHLRTTSNQETVLFVCILFVCIDMLRGQCQGAIDHCRHGINILNGVKLKSTFTKNYLEPAFCRLGVFPFFFGVSPETFPAIATPCPAPNPPFCSLLEVQAALDPLIVRTIRFIRTADEYRLGDENSPEPDASALQERNDIDAALDAWLTGFQVFKKRKTTQKCKFGAMREAIVERLHESKYLLGKIWIDTCFSRGETVYDLHMEKFRDILELAGQAEAILRSMWNKYPRAKFTFEMGFTPLLAFILIKCRSLSLRAKAMQLMKALAHGKENLWELRTVTAFVGQMIKFEHGLQFDLDGDTADVIDDGTLPPEERRIKDSAVQHETRVITGSDGVVTVWKKVALLLREPEGPVTVREEWFSVQLRRKP